MEKHLTSNHKTLSLMSLRGSIPHRRLTSRLMMWPEYFSRQRLIEDEIFYGRTLVGEKERCANSPLDMSCESQFIHSIILWDMEAVKEGLWESMNVNILQWIFRYIESKTHKYILHHQNGKKKNGDNWEENRCAFDPLSEHLNFKIIQSTN